MASQEHAELRLKEIIEHLSRHEVDFVLIGGMAGMALGSAYPSYDVDIACASTHSNSVMASSRRSSQELAMASR